MYEKPYRSIIKALSWRVTATLTTVIVSFFVTGEISVALSIGAIELFTKMFLYYIHERTWNKIKIGRVEPKSDYQI